MTLIIKAGSSLIIRLLLISAALFYAMGAYAEMSIRMVGSFGSKAVVEIGGKRHVLSASDISPEGVEVIEVSGDYVILKFGGKAERYNLGDATISTVYSESDSIAVNLYQDGSGMFRAQGAINNIPVSYLVDTGATAVAMSSQQAKRLGLDYRKKGQPTKVSTAAGNVTGYYLKLNTVSVDKIKLHQVDAIVIEGNSPAEVLLGMSFLGRLKVQHQGSVMTLRINQ